MSLDFQRFGIDNYTIINYEQVYKYIGDVIYTDAINIRFEETESNLLYIKDDSNIINYLKSKCNIFNTLYNDLDKSDYTEFCNELVYCWLIHLSCQTKFF